MVIEIGTVAIKTTGREASRYCVVVKKVDDNFVIVTGPKILTGVKRRRCNIRHLEELPYKLDIKEDASDKEVLDAWIKSGLYKKLGLKLPAAHEVKESLKEEKSEEKKEEAKEKKEEKKRGKKKQSEEK